ncbi:MAG: nitrogen fixation protein NifQ [Chloroflexota bacterium]|jgi:nitrogen fixation protein NifQ
MIALAPSNEPVASAKSSPSAESIYSRILSRPTGPAAGNQFTTHILACALTIGLIEARETGISVSAALGLDRASLAALTDQWAPAARDLFDLASQPEAVSLDEEEEQLHQLLTHFSVDSSPLCGWITAIVARRAMSPRHLWQDLGLLERRELTQLMNDWFPTLAAANTDNMKWKKFFYRKLCELEGFSLCAAPTCRECGDFDNCFGEEDGVSALARLSRR